MTSTTVPIKCSHHRHRHSSSSSPSFPSRHINPPIIITTTRVTTSFIIISTILIILVYNVNGTNGDTNRMYHVSKLCVRDRNFPMYKKIDGAVIESESESDLECVLTFQTDSILQRFMLKFDKLALDCNDHLYIYDGAHAFGNYKADLSCRSTRNEIGTIFTQSNFLTIKYVTDRYSKPGDGFKLTITAFKDTPSIGCNQFKCQNTFCISKDLVCDSVNHCGDDSDESPSHAFCYTAKKDVGSPLQSILGIEFNIFMAIVLSIFVICLICVVNLAVCLCRNGGGNNNLGSSSAAYMNGMNLMTGQQIAQLQHGLSTANLSSAHPAYAMQSMTTANISNSGVNTTRYATLPLDKGTGNGKIPPPYPGINGTTVIYGTTTNPGGHYVTTSMSNNQVTAGGGGGQHVMVSNVDPHGQQQQQQQLQMANGSLLMANGQQQQQLGHQQQMVQMNGISPFHHQQVVYYK